MLSGGPGSWAQIGNSGTAQSITLTHSNKLSVIAAADFANINSNGAQTISLTGTGANAIQVGGASSAGSSWIGANGAQSITAGTGAQSGSITLTGGTVAGQGVDIGANSSATTQTISTSGVLSLIGGSASGGTNPCADQGVCVSIYGSGQSISANGIVVQGGPSGIGNAASIGNNVGSGGQRLDRRQWWHSDHRRGWRGGIDQSELVGRHADHCGDRWQRFSGWWWRGE